MTTPPESESGNGRLVLVVDDNDAIRNLVSALLRREKYTVETAADGLEAVLKIGLADYSLIFLDLMMPLVSGSEILEFLATEKPEVLPRVIIMTAAGEKDISPLERYKTGPVIRKPFDIGEFVASVKGWAEKLRAEGGL